MKKMIALLMMAVALSSCSGNVAESSSSDDYDGMLPSASDIVNKTVTLQETFKAFSMLPGTIHFTDKVGFGYVTDDFGYCHPIFSQENKGKELAHYYKVENGKETSLPRASFKDGERVCFSYDPQFSFAVGYTNDIAKYDESLITPFVKMKGKIGKEDEKVYFTSEAGVKYTSFATSYAFVTSDFIRMDNPDFAKSYIAYTITKTLADGSEKTAIPLFVAE